MNAYRVFIDEWGPVVVVCQSYDRIESVLEPTMWPFEQVEMVEFLGEVVME